MPGWLLIFDNADQVAGHPGRGCRPARCRPGIPGHVIVTTRRGGFAALGHVLDLDVIDLPDAVRLLRARVPGLGQDIGEQIAEELGRLPLALEQAAAYLDMSGMPGQDYLGLLRGRGPRAAHTGAGRPGGRTRSPRCGTSASSRITGENPAAVQLLDMCAYLAPEPIPLDLFTAPC